MSSGVSKFTLLVIVTIVVGFLVTWDLNNRQAEKVMQMEKDMDDVEFVPDNASEAVIPVSGMSCRSCEMSIERALKELDGIYRVSADHVNKKVVAHYDPERVSLSEMRDGIVKAGYTPGDPIEE